MLRGAGRLWGTWKGLTGRGVRTLEGSGGGVGASANREYEPAEDCEDTDDLRETILARSSGGMMYATMEVGLDCALGVSAPEPATSSSEAIDAARLVCNVGSEDMRFARRTRPRIVSVVENMEDGVSGGRSYGGGECGTRSGSCKGAGWLTFGVSDGGMGGRGRRWMGSL